MKSTDFQNIASAVPEDAGRHFKPSIGSVIAMALLVPLLVLMLAAPASAQLTGGVSGTVIDAQGGVVPGATVTLNSQTKGTKVGTTITNDKGAFLIPNVAPDKYEIVVEMALFKTLKRSDIDISPGPVTTIGDLKIEVGGSSETVVVTGEAPLIQSASGEKSFTVNNLQMASLPINGRDFSALLQLMPGVDIGTGLTTAEVLGGAGASNFMVDGVVNMEPGINRQALKISVDAIQEVKAISRPAIRRSTAGPPDCN